MNELNYILKIKKSVDCFNEKGNVIKFQSIISRRVYNYEYKETVGFFFPRTITKRDKIDHSKYLLYSDDEVSVVYDASILIYTFTNYWKSNGYLCSYEYRITKDVLFSDEFSSCHYKNYSECLKREILRTKDLI